MEGKLSISIRRLLHENSVTSLLLSRESVLAIIEDMEEYKPFKSFVEDNKKEKSFEVFKDKIRLWVREQ